MLLNGKPDPNLVQVLINARAANNPVGLISNHHEPDWFAGSFGGSGVQFLHNKGRQSGEIVSQNAKNFSLNPFDVLVLAGKDEDVQMGKNGHALLIAAGWSTAKQVVPLGIRVDDAKQFQEIIDLTTGWLGQWWFTGDEPRYRVRALSDLSSKYGKTITQRVFAQKLTSTVKNGGSRLNALLAVTARSLLMEGTDSQEGLVWGVYPSSSSANDDDEILSDFTHRLRTTVSRVRFSKRGEPLFIRHTPSTKRSMGGGGDRTDPTNQILTVHLNPFYKESNRLLGKHVIVVDDCTTYGVSFGVASAFLRKAGAASITGVALGKFGGQLRYYEIDIQTDPFKPVVAGGFTSIAPGWFQGATSSVTQQVLQTLIP
ncbi:phosphoribosyltransferase [Sulfurirhabdus autotrophica]|uniref:phosphoribosyltransferase n=1 Tax=Sulfurirhabdus autotrophica TaxID=1706046 RepID=UPI001CB995F3|nr:phosphoribosyltransferase [Sulfurirhabdus autotrophica]